MISVLTDSVSGPVLVPGDPGYAAEVAAFNTAVTHVPDVVVGVESVADVVEAVRFARENKYAVTVQATGHGAHVPVASGLLISTRRLDEVRVDVGSRTATVGAGVRWGELIAAVAGTGLFPIPGSSTTVGVVGYLLGGGLGPLVRSHGFSSDYLLGLTVVSGTGEVLEVTADSDPDLLWALRGGKAGLGVVTSARLRLVELETLYAGSLFFAEEHMEAALRGWVDWVGSADPMVSTSVAVMRFPSLDVVPEPLRGRCLLSLRFACPAGVDDGVRLAAPLRALAPVYLDLLGELPVSDFGRIHNDPPVPGPSYVRGALLTDADQGFVSALLGQVGAGVEAPFVAVEVRHLGSAAGRDVDGGSAVGGRGAGFTLGLVGVEPALLEIEVPAAAERVVEAVGSWVAAETNVNFMGVPRSAGHFASAWSVETFARLAEVRRRVDPDGVFGFGFAGA